MWTKLADGRRMFGRLRLSPRLVFPARGAVLECAVDLLIDGKTLLRSSVEVLKKLQNSPKTPPKS